MKPALLVSDIKQYIYSVRGNEVMLDSDLSTLYQLDTKNLNKAVHRNLKKFPEDFCFRLYQTEYDSLRFQIGTLKNGRGEHRKYLPFVFTEQGIAMLSGVLKNDRAIEVNIAIMRTFIQLRKAARIYADLPSRVDHLEKKLDGLKQQCIDQSRILLQAVQSLKTEKYAEIPQLSPLDSHAPKMQGLGVPQRDIETILNAVARYHGLGTQDLMTTKRTRTTAIARQIAMYLIREKTGMGYRQIGLHFGGRDHTTFLHACRRIKVKLDTDQKIRLAVGSIQRAVDLK